MRDWMLPVPSPRLMTRRRLISSAVGGLLIALSIAASLYLFRQQSWDTSVLGAMSLSYRWGRPSLFRLDSNRDGEVDVAYRLTGEVVESSSHWEWSNGWESTHCDGRRDLQLQKREGVLEVRFDSDRDGDHDVVVEGAEAELFLRDLVRSAVCHPVERR